MKRNSFFDRALCLFFPRRCKYCGEVIAPENEICENCRELPVISGEVCFDCGYSKSECSCKNKKHYYDRIAAPFYYEGAVETAVSRLKFNNLPFLAKEYAADMADTLGERFLDDTHYDLIMYVPASGSTIRKREYNQSELLADGISEITGIPVSHSLVKIYETGIQHSMPRFDRTGNVFAAFDLKDKDEPAGKNILLVDDIKTTGSTLNECAKLLKIYGAGQVDCICFAVAKWKQNIDTED